MNPKLEALSRLWDSTKECKKCVGCLNSTRVCGRGNTNSKIAVIGEGPGREECEKGIPFVGPAGKLLDNILLAIDLKREDLYFTNSVICRTSTSNRTPTQSELNNCSKRLFDELSIIKPVVTLLVGSTALRTIFGADYKIMKAHGEWLTTLSYPCFFYFPIPHPSWILHSSTEGETLFRKRLVWKDIRQFYNDLEVFKTLKYYNK